MDVEAIKHEFIDRYKSVGKERFYSFILTFGVDKLVKIKDGQNIVSPEVEFLDYSDKFLMLYRRGLDIDYLELSNLFRKAAHKIYRVGLKQKLLEHNARFLNLVI